LPEQTINIIIPVYNEEQYILTVINEVVAESSGYNQNVRIITVNDGSTDNTRVLIEDFISKNPLLDIIYINNEKNFGKGFSVRRGIQNCKEGIIIIQDSDLEYSPSEYKKLINPILQGKTDVVYGSRFQGSEPKRVLYYGHYVANKMITTLSNIFTRLNLSDIETCYKAFKTSAIKEIRLKENRFGFEPEITAKLSRVKGIRFAEVGISYFGRTYSEGKKIKFKDAVRTVYCIFKYNIWSRK